jgi:protein phosphatase 2C
MTTTTTDMACAVSDMASAVSPADDDTRILPVKRAREDEPEDSRPFKRSRCGLQETIEQQQQQQPLLEQEHREYAMQAISDVNLRPAQEDTHVIARFGRSVHDGLQSEAMPMVSVAAVFDGHGGAGVSAHFRDNLVGYLRPRMASASSISDALTEALLAIDGDLTDDVAADSGSTGVVVLVDEGSRTIVCANTGDSRAILARKIDGDRHGGDRDGDNDGVEPLSSDHDPEREDERSRIEAAGGVMFDRKGGLRVGGVLNMTRAFGDKRLRPDGLIPDPETKTVSSDYADFVVVASDGLWDVMSNKKTATIARRALNRAAVRGCTPEAGARVAAKVLTKYAKTLGSKDNVTVVVVDLDLDRVRLRPL